MAGIPYRTIFIGAVILLAVGGLIMLVVYLIVKSQAGKAKKFQKIPSAATIYSVVKQENGMNIQAKIKKVDGKKPDKVAYMNGYGVYLQPGRRTLDIALSTQVIDSTSKTIPMYKLQKESSVAFDVGADMVYTLQFDAEGSNYHLTEGLSQ